MGTTRTRTLKTGLGSFLALEEGGINGFSEGELYQLLDHERLSVEPRLGTEDQSPLSVDHGEAPVRAGQEETRGFVCLHDDSRLVPRPLFRRRERDSRRTTSSDRTAASFLPPPAHDAGAPSPKSSS